MGGLFEENNIFSNFITLTSEALILILRYSQILSHEFLSMKFKDLKYMVTGLPDCERKYKK